MVVAESYYGDAFLQQRLGIWSEMLIKLNTEAVKENVVICKKIWDWAGGLPIRRKATRNKHLIWQNWKVQVHRHSLCNLTEICFENKYR